LAALGVVLAGSLSLGMLERRKPAWWGGYAMLMAAGVLAAVLLLDPKAFDPLVHIVQVIVINKTSSNSYIDRAVWNQVAYQAYLATHYLGVGVGGARASSWIYSLLSNIGLPGTVLLFGFMAQVFLTPAADPA